MVIGVGRYIQEMTKKPCLRPFLQVHITDNGSVFPCCSCYMDGPPWGNIFKQSFDEIWNGKIACRMRRQMLRGDFSSCNLDFCNMYDNCGGTVNRKLNKKELSELKKKMPYPKRVTLDYDKECNAKCITCRKDFFQHDNESLTKMNKWADRVIVPICKNAEILYTSGSGDPLASRHSRYLIKQIVKKNPAVKIKFHTNGILASQKIFEELNLLPCVLEVNISLHAASKKVYDKIVLGGNWEAVMSNLRWLSKLKAAGKLEYLKLSFTLSALNFHELPAFLKLTEKLQAWPTVWEYRNWGVQNEAEAKDLNVLDPCHRQHRKLLKVMRSAKVQKYLRYQNVFSPELVKLAPLKPISRISKLQSVVASRLYWLGKFRKANQSR